MAKKKPETAVSTQAPETAVQPTQEPRNLIGAAVEHLFVAAQMLRSKGGDKAAPCAYVATQLDHWIDQLEKLNE